MKQYVWGDATGLASDKVIRLMIGDGPYWPQGEAVFNDSTTWQALAQFGDDPKINVGVPYTLHVMVMSRGTSSGLAAKVDTLPGSTVATFTVLRNDKPGPCAA
ncbi:hypothetical protein [Hamadaea tsunoensis]|uniref:hypothetical protein n=1 Tax=Hamadaea tsunoensis TaxID=53368 RepID=UPI000416EDBD|nr:hypothetical protein [Hamadaea tsunoensis]